MKWLMLWLTLQTSFSAAASSQQPGNFDELVQALGGSIPFPMEAWIQKMKPLMNGKDPIMVLNPMGRSRLRKVADYSSPLVLLAFDANPAKKDLLRDLYTTDYKLPVFVNYSRQLETAEVIAWNQDTGAFDFKIIADYGPGKTPIVITPPRVQCRSCHQSEGPHFALAPWGEFPGLKTEYDSNPEVLHELSKNRTGLSPLEQAILKATETPSTSSPAVSATALISMSVISANALRDGRVTLERILAAVPEEEKMECKKFLLLTAFVHSPRGSSHNERQSRIDLLKKEPYYSKLLAHLRTAPAHFSYLALPEPHFKERPSLVPIEGMLEPSLPRPKRKSRLWADEIPSMAIVNGLGLTRRDRDLAPEGQEAFASVYFDRLKAAVSSPEIHQLLEKSAWPPRPPQILEEMRKALRDNKGLSQTPKL